MENFANIVKSSGLEKDVSDIWKTLNQMHKDDPKKYQKFINQQLNDAKKCTSIPKPHCFIMVKMRNVNGKRKALFMNICSWDRISYSSLKKNQPINISSGTLYRSKDDNDKFFTVNVALNLKVLEENESSSFVNFVVKDRQFFQLFNIIADMLQSQHKIEIYDRDKAPMIHKKYHGPWSEIPNNITCNMKKIGSDSFSINTVLQNLKGLNMDSEPSPQVSIDKNVLDKDAHKKKPTESLKSVFDEIVAGTDKKRKSTESNKGQVKIKLSVEKSPPKKMEKKDPDVSYTCDLIKTVKIAKEITRHDAVVSPNDVIKCLDLSTTKETLEAHITLSIGVDISCINLQVAGTIINIFYKGHVVQQVKIPIQDQEADRSRITSKFYSTRNVLKIVYQF